ncbi:MAG: RNA methyltransferase [Saprospiraceae bacterium]|nr:RNA methyltransferase [Pyrinomonadaceae bacterium]
MKDKIISRDNERLKSVRRIRDGKTPGTIFIEGVRLAEEVLRSTIAVNECFVSGDFANANRKTALIDEMNRRGISISEVDANIFPSISDTANSQGIVLIGKRPADSKAQIEKSLHDSALVIFLHEIGDPANLGAVLRTAEAAGVAGVVISRDSADVFSSRALRASMGSSLRVPIWEGADFSEVILWSNEHGLRTTAADVSSKIPYSQIDWLRPRLLIFGSEAHGLGGDIIEHIDEVTYIPMENNVESLNLAVSCGVILFEANRQRQITGYRIG